MLNSIINGSKALENALAGEELSFNDGMELMNYDNISCWERLLIE